MNSYELSRNWFDWCFDNPDKIKPNHTALYFFCIEHCNRLGWQEKFGLPTEMAKSAIGIHSYNTYISTLKDLIEFGFIKLITKSKNQFSSNIIGLSNFNKATTKALDKAIVKHVSKQGESTIQSIDSINKPLNQEPINNKTEPSIQNFKVTDLIITNILEMNSLLSHWSGVSKLSPERTRTELKNFLEDKKAIEKPYENIADLKSHISNWFKSNKFDNETKNGHIPKIDTSKNIYESKAPDKWI